MTTAYTPPDARSNHNSGHARPESLGSVLAKLLLPETIDPETITAMRGWISDCMWDDLDPEDIDELSDATIIRGVRRHYSGGVQQFIADK